ncbi:hypothetical protein ABE82_19490 [Paenibacillus peoriae]|uniref:hypothetical protein n=1 Tax=Paenibacillus peoriae TaxID=59893 RepID=UPI0006A701EE|nr:hypothetical protein [Paenibacillus peoriae]ALA43542.1 hypothetical protein ABE82_19490 [Paenibacillus peoriae]
MITNNLQKSREIHRFLATLLSILGTGLGMFYLAIPSYMIGGAALIITQGILIYFTMFSLGYLLIISGPLAIFFHILGIVFTVRSFQIPHHAERAPTGVSLPSKWRTLLSLALGATLLLLAVTMKYVDIIEPFTQTGENKRNVAAESEQYLEQKYGEDFQIQNISYHSIPSTEYTMEVISNRHPSVLFNMTKRPYEDVPFRENYLNALWESQLDMKLKPVIQKLYDDSAAVHSGVQEGTTDKMIKEYDDFKLNPKAVGDQYIRIIVFEDLTDSGLPLEKERVLQTAKVLKTVLDGNKASLDIEYFPSTMNTKQNLKAIEINDYMFGQDHFDEKTYEVQIEDIYKLMSTKDIQITSLDRVN